MIRDKVFFYCKVLAGLGLSLSIYLLWQKLFHPDVQPCNINNWINCDAVISGPVANTLRIPTPLYGLIGYIVIFFAAIFKKTRLMLGMAGFGLVFCLYIAYQELFLLRVICPVCIGCQIVMIAVFILSIKLLKIPADNRL